MIHWMVMYPYELRKFLKVHKNNFVVKNTRQLFEMSVSNVYCDIGNFGLLNIFTGSTIEKCGNVGPGDELLSINGIDVSQMTRIDTWTLMKKLPEGEVILRIRR